MTEQAKQFCDDQIAAGLEYSAQFVPLSQSRNANSESPSQALIGASHCAKAT